MSCVAAPGLCLSGIGVTGQSQLDLEWCLEVVPPLALALGDHGDDVTFPVIADRDRVLLAALPPGEAEQGDTLSDHALETGSGQGPFHHRVGPVRWPIVGQPDFGGRGIGHLCLQSSIPDDMSIVREAALSVARGEGNEFGSFSRCRRD